MLNPLRWSREHQVAGVLICLIGAFAGTFFAWMESPIRRLSLSNISGEWSDYTGVFLMWLQHGHLYWLWAVLGAAIAGLAFYVVRLLMPSDAQKRT